MFSLPLPTSVVSGKKNWNSVVQGSCSNFDSDPSAFSTQVRRGTRVTQPPPSFSFPPRQGRRGPDRKPWVFGSQSHVRKLSDPCGCHWPTSEVVQGASEGFGGFFPPSFSNSSANGGLPPAAAICARPQNAYRIPPLKANHR